MELDVIEKQPRFYKQIKEALNKGFLSHSYLIESVNLRDEQVNKYIRFFVKTIYDNFYSDNISISKEKMFHLIDNLEFPDYIEIRPVNNVIKKEQLLRIRDDFSNKSLYNTKKIYTVYNADKMNVNSSNTILKFLEEPQEGIIAILITNNIYQLLDTIISRCQIISLNGQVDLENKNTFNKIAQLLTDNNEDYNNFINDESNKEKLEALLKFIKYYENNHKKILLYMNDYWFNYFNDKQEMSKYILIMIYFYKDVLNYKINCNIEIFNDYLDLIEDIANKNTVDNLVNKITVINEHRTYLEYNANLNLLMDKIIIELESGVR